MMGGYVLQTPPDLGQLRSAPRASPPPGRRSTSSGQATTSSSPSRERTRTCDRSSCPSGRGARCSPRATRASFRCRSSWRSADPPPRAERGGVPAKPRRARAIASGGDRARNARHAVHRQQIVSRIGLPRPLTPGGAVYARTICPSARRASPHGSRRAERAADQSGMRSASRCGRAAPHERESVSRIEDAAGSATTGGHAPCVAHAQPLARIDTTGRDR